MTEYIIETKDLTKRFGKDVAVNSVNMKIERGQIYGLLGRNGAGKTNHNVHASKFIKTKLRRNNIFGERLPKTTKRKLPPR